MRNAQKYIELVHNKDRYGQPLTRVYTNLLNTELFLNAYGKLYSNKGSTTKGVDPDDTVQGMSMEKIEQIIGKLKNRTYQWQPVKRVEIPKKNGKRPLGIPVWSDKLVGEVIRTILQAYYEPQFVNSSHGFRPKRGCHTALQEIGKWHGTKWWIEGDIKGCFQNINHNILLEIIERNVKDKSLLNLIKNMLKAGYLQDWKYHQTYSGSPQGGVLSPLLANILLNELDQYIENELIPQYTKGEKRKINPIYHRISRAVRTAKKRRQIKLYKELRKQKRQTPTQDTHDPDFRRLKYVRYCDDFLLGFIGPKQEALEIKQKIAEFLTSIGLRMSEEKTLITHASQEKARFLGYEIHIALDNNRITKNKKTAKKITRAVNGTPIFSVPKDVIELWGNRFTQKGKTIHRPYLLQCTDFEITMIYGLELQGLINYYSLAHNVSSLYKVKYHFITSLVKTIAAKHKQSAKEVYRKYYKQSDDGINAIIVEIPNPNNPEKPLRAKCGDKPIRRKKDTIIIDEKPQLYTSRTELVQRLIANQCELCGSMDKIRVHHVRALKDVHRKYKGRTEPPQWAKFMMERHRKTVVVCQKCHIEIHQGTYDGKPVKLRPTGERSATETRTLRSEGAS